MEEKVLIKSKSVSLMNSLIRYFIVPVIFFVIMIVYYYTIGHSAIMSHLGSNYNASLARFFTGALIFEFDAVGSWFVPIIFYIGIVTLIWGIVSFLKYKDMNVTVTDKRIYGVSSFGKRVDFPISAISSVSASGKRDINLLTPSGKILFGNFENTDELFQTISKMLVARQG